MEPVQFKIPYIGDITYLPDARLISFWDHICTNLGEKYVFYLLGAFFVIATGICGTIISTWLFRYFGKSTPLSKKYRTPLVPKRKQSAYPPGMDVDKAWEEVRKTNPGAAPPLDATASSSAVKQIRFSNAPLPVFPQVPKGEIKRNPGRR